MHANTAADVPVRLEALGSLAGLDRPALHSQLRAALDLVVHLVREPGSGRRRVAEIHTLAAGRDGLAVTTPAVEFPVVGGLVPGAGWERLVGLLAVRGVSLAAGPT
ncbi:MULTISPECIES: hypothetical protein [unclassified Kitasatospora]|uniref:hypothetical protein n=1 Tax=unclassified Kitasatospora TaxID=2633591 RepID=UPI0037F5134A